MRRLVLCFLCLLFVASGCKNRGKESIPAPPTGRENYFPMAKGNRWVWVGGVVPATGDTIRWEVKDRVVRNTGKFAWKVETGRYWQGKHGAVIDSMNLEVEPGCLLMYMDAIDPDADTVLNYPLAQGKKWRVAYIITKHLTRNSQVIGTEDVATPYGKFMGALRVDSEDRSAEKDSLIMKTSDWYVPNVGRIMTRVEARGGVWEMKLLSMELH